MSESRNVQVVKDAYAAFLRGDVQSILASLDQNVEWEGVKGAEGVAPHAGLRRGPAQVAQFFQQVGGSIEFHKFEPREFIAQGDQVAVVGEYEGSLKENGTRMKSDWVMVFTIRDGKIARFREWTDSAQLVRAYGAVPAAARA
jgi:ketosteroid isomerase-like protein